MNKNMVHIIKEAIEDHPRSYHKALSNALWEDRVHLRIQLETPLGV
jgi:hypothetical protein